MSHDGYKALAAAVVLQACRDLAAGDDALVRLDAWAFLVGRGGELFTEIVDMSGPALVERVIERPAVRKRLKKLESGGRENVGSTE